MTSAGGGQHRRDYIAISLFGTDEITKGKKRIHGYSVSKLVIDNDNAKIILWPLQREKRDSGRYTIDRDGSYELNEDGSIESDTIRIKNPKAGTSAASGNEAVSTCPQPPTDLLGRKSLINDAIALLRDPNRRLITLAGPAGIGRTTIALNLMEKIRGDFKDGVYFCSFQDVKALDELISRINSKVANVQDAKEESLFNWLRDKNCLLILDNFEDPLEDKAANIPGFIMNLLNQAPGVKLLVTTRESMTIAGIEKIIHVDILNDADSEALIRKLADDLDLTKYIDGKDLTGLLKQLGGVPLAIVLAVPNLVLGIDVLTEELERQNLDILSQYGIDVASAIKDQSLVKSFLLSYSKIKDTNERLLFLICSLFPSGLKKLDANKILFGLKPQMFQSLIFKSLISCPKDNTYTMLAPMRAFAYGMFKRMAAENEIDISVIVRWINLCDEKSQEYYKTTHRTGKRAINELIDELPDMFRVLDYLISTSEKGTLLKILLNLVDFSSSVGITKEVMSSLEEAAKIAKASGDILGEANCIYRIGDIHFYESRNNDALNSYNSALPLYKQVDNILGEANCIRRIGDIHLRESRNNDALNSYNSALPLYEQVGDILGEANCISGIGEIHLRESRNNDALNFYNSALPLYKQVGNILGEANCISGIGEIHLRESRNNDALNSYNSALPLYKQVGDILGEANCISGIGGIHLRESRNNDALNSYKSALPLYKQVGDILGEANCISGIGDIHLRESRNNDALNSYNSALPLYKQVGNILGEANCISGIGLILIRDDKTKDGIDEVLKAVSLYEKIKDKQSIGLAYNDLADELEKKADYQPQALEYRTKATEILKSVQWSGLQRRGDAV